MSDLIALYFFLGGTGAGTLVAVAVLDAFFLNCSFRDTDPGLSRHLEIVTSRGYIAAFVLVALGSFLLLLDLDRPDRALLLFLSPTSSYITFGAYSLLLLTGCAFFLAFAPAFGGGRTTYRRAVNVIRVMAILSGICVMIYPGTFLFSLRSVPLWHSAALPILFVLSAVSNGLAVILLCSCYNGGVLRASRVFEASIAKIDFGFVIAEVIAALLLLARASSDPFGAKSVERLMVGDGTLLFVGGFACLGLFLPAVLDAFMIRGERREWLPAVASSAALVGGLCLRLSIVGSAVYVTA